MNDLFKQKLCKENWGDIFQDISLFKELIHYIFLKEGLAIPKKIDNLTPGTNAVFKVDDFVIKIFAPVETDYGSYEEYEIELISLNHAKTCGIHCPRVLKTGVVYDSFIFYYIIMDYIEGIEAKKVAKTFTSLEKKGFAKRMAKLSTQLNINIDLPMYAKNLENRMFDASKWKDYHDDVTEQIFQYLRQCRLENYVYVHGDLTSDNILIDEVKEQYIIDFADSLLAPVCYEYPPILFDLFDFDLTLMKTYIEELTITIDDIFMGLLIHEFGYDFTRLIYKRLAGKDIHELNNIFEIKKLLNDYLFLDYYKENASLYINQTKPFDMKDQYEVFEKYLPQHGKILDIGFGSGRDSLYFSINHKVVSIDTCEEFVLAGKQNLNNEVLLLDVRDINYKGEFDGIFACASLLHMPFEELPMIFKKCFDALKENGVMYVSFKYGDYEGMRDGRYYTDLDEERLKHCIQHTGFRIMNLFQTIDKRHVDTRWLNVILKN